MTIEPNRDVGGSTKYHKKEDCHAIPPSPGPNPAGGVASLVVVFASSNSEAQVPALGDPNLLENGGVELTFFEPDQGGTTTSLFWFIWQPEMTVAARLETDESNQRHGDRPIEIEEDAEDIPEGCATCEERVLHFRWPTVVTGGLLQDYATYGGSADRVPGAGALRLHQWAASPITIEFDAVASEDDAELYVDLGDITPAPVGGPFWHSEPFVLTTDWAHYSFVLQEQDGLDELDALESFFLRLGLVQGQAGEDVQAWVDNIRVTDDPPDIFPCEVHVGLPPNGTTPADLAIDEDGIVTLDGEAFLPQILWFTDYPKDSEGRLDWPELDALLEEASGAGFNAIFLDFSPGVHAYNTKRELWRFMRLAGCHDLFVVARVPSYPSAGDATVNWPVHRGYAVEWLIEFNDHPALLAWVTGDELSMTDYGEDDDPLGGRIDNHRVLKWARYSENPANGGSGFYRPVLGITGREPLEAADDPSHWFGEYTNPWFVMSRLATAVDIIVPNVFIKDGHSASSLDQTISRATDIVRKSQLLCEGDDKTCPGLLKDPSQPEDCEDSAVPGYCWSNKAVWPMIQLGPNKEVDRNIWANELEIMEVQGLLHGASGFILAKSHGALASAETSDYSLDCSDWDPEDPLDPCYGVIKSELSSDCPQWRLLEQNYRECWDTMASELTDPLLAELWQELPLIFDRLDMLHEEMIGGLPAPGTTRQWRIDSASNLTKVQATYVSAAVPTVDHSGSDHLLWGDYTLWGDDNVIDPQDIVSRALIRFDVADLAGGSAPIYKAELTLPISGRTCDGSDLTQPGGELDCYQYQSEQVVVAAVPGDGVFNWWQWDAEDVTWDNFERVWRENGEELPDVKVPFAKVSSFFHPLRHYRSPFIQPDPQLIVLDVTGIVADWLHPSNPEPNNGFIVTQYDGHWGYPVGVLSASDDKIEPAWNPRKYPNLRLYRKAGEPFVRPLPVALEADNDRVEMRMLKQTCPFGYAHVLVSHADDFGVCQNPRLRVVLPQPPGSLKAQLWNLDGEFVQALDFNEVDVCDQDWGEGGDGPCSSGCSDDDPDVYRIDVPMITNGYNAVIVAIPRLGL